MGVNTDGRREVLGMEIGTFEAEAIWTEFLRKLTRRGLRGVKLVVFDAHEGIKAAPCRRCSLPPGSAAGFISCAMRLAHAGKSGRRVVSAFTRDTPQAASAQWRNGEAEERIIQ